MRSISLSFDSEEAIFADTSFSNGVRMPVSVTLNPLRIPGISYYYPPEGASLKARDGRVDLDYGGIPVPLMDDDFNALSGSEPTYDAVGRGVYQLLRSNPDAPFADRYALIFRDAYPHLFSEVATELVMLDKKDVDLPYLDRKINYLKIFALLEPDNHRFPLEIGATFIDKALTIAALGKTTIYLFAAEKYLGRAHALAADDLQTRQLAGEVAFLLGKYDAAAGFWEGIEGSLPENAAKTVAARLSRITAGEFPLVPAIDYLQAVGVAMEAFEFGDYEEAAAIILDVLDAISQYEELPLAEINYLLGLCYLKLDIPRYAEQYLRRAVDLRPDFNEAREELAGMGVA